MQAITAFLCMHTGRPVSPYACVWSGKCMHACRPVLMHACMRASTCMHAGKCMYACGPVFVCMWAGFCMHAGQYMYASGPVYVCKRASTCIICGPVHVCMRAGTFGPVHVCMRASTCGPVHVRAGRYSITITSLPYSSLTHKKQLLAFLVMTRANTTFCYFKYYFLLFFSFLVLENNHIKLADQYG